MPEYDRDRPDTWPARLQDATGYQLDADEAAQEQDHPACLHCTREIVLADVGGYQDWTHTDNGAVKCEQQRATPTMSPTERVAEHQGHPDGPDRCPGSDVVIFGPTNSTLLHVTEIRCSACDQSVELYTDAGNWRKRPHNRP